MSRERDFQRSLVYSAEHQLQWFYDNVEHASINLFGVPLQLEPEVRYGDLRAIQAYVDRVITMPSVIAEFGRYGRVFIRERKGDKAAHYRVGVIAVNTKGSRWAMRETVLLHELAHHFAGTGCGHGPKFAAALVKLLELVMGPQAAMAQRILYDTEGVKVG